MKRSLLILLVGAISAASAQTTPKNSSGTPAKTNNPSATAAASTKPATASAQPEPWIKLPAGVPRVVHGPVKIPLALRYEDIKVGTGAEGEAGKAWHLKYTGWRAADGVKFDSWDEHGLPVIGADGKPELGPDGKPKMGEPKPLEIQQGVGRVIPGFDFGLVGMKIGGKRRIFIPWQLAYGMRAMPDRPDHPGIPAKSDLIFDVELVDVTDAPQPRPAAMPFPRPGVPPQPGASQRPNSVPSAPAAPGSSAAPAPPAATQPAPQGQAQPH